MNQTGKNVPKDSKIKDIVLGVKDVKDVHNINIYRSDAKINVNLHIMVERDIDLFQAHEIADKVEHEIHKELIEIDHVTIHLEPYVTVPEVFHTDSQDTEEKIKSLVKEYSEIREVTRILSLYFKDVLKIEIDCSFDGQLPIEKVHDITSEIERKIKSQFKNSIITIHPEPI